MKRYIVDGNVTDTRHVVGFASERLFVDYTDHAALLRAVANEAGKMPHEQSCRAHKHCKICDKPPWANHHRADIPSHHAHVFSPGDCDCQRGKVLAMLEVE